MPPISIFYKNLPIYFHLFHYKEVEEYALHAETLQECANGAE